MTRKIINRVALLILMTSILSSILWILACIIYIGIFAPFTSYLPYIVSSKDSLLRKLAPQRPSCSYYDMLSLEFPQFNRLLL